MSSELENKQKERILKLLSEKSVVKQDVFQNSVQVFNNLKSILIAKAEELSSDIGKVDKRININYKDLNPQSGQLKIAGDVLDFYLHSNVFEFDHSHPMYKTSYIHNNEYNSLCGIINIYNFLADSFKYKRFRDVGYLIGRIFINREKRFFMETRTQLGYKYYAFSAQEITNDQLSEIVNELIIFAVSFDLFTPPYDAVKEVSVMEIQEKTSSSALRTGKRLGYVGYDNSSGIEEDINL
jgi:hypothetical protein